MSHALIYYLEINIYQGIYKFTSLVHIIIIMVIDLCDGLMFLSLVCRSLGSLTYLRIHKWDRPSYCYVGWHIRFLVTWGIVPPPGNTDVNTRPYRHYNPRTRSCPRLIHLWTCLGNEVGLWSGEAVRMHPLHCPNPYLLGCSVGCKLWLFGLMAYPVCCSYFDLVDSLLITLLLDPDVPPGFTLLAPYLYCWFACTGDSFWAGLRHTYRSVEHFLHYQVTPLWISWLLFLICLSRL